MNITLINTVHSSEPSYEGSDQSKKRPGKPLLSIYILAPNKKDRARTPPPPRRPVQFPQQGKVNCTTCGKVFDLGKHNIDFRMHFWCLSKERLKKRTLQAKVDLLKNSLQLYEQESPQAPQAHHYIATKKDLEQAQGLYDKIQSTTPHHRKLRPSNVQKLIEAQA